MAKKKVVYLLGAGATQAAVSVVDSTCQILTRDITQEIVLKIRHEKQESLLPLSNIMLDGDVDIEHLITLLDESHSPRHLKMASDLRQLFWKEIRNRLGRYTLKLTPNLYAALFDMHNVKGFNEELAGVITLNYDQIAEIGFSEVFGGIHYVIHTISDHSILRTDLSLPAFIKLHGSFNWLNQYPITLVDENKVDEGNLLWIPPGLGKTGDLYPFNLLWGHAHELLECDVLRIIGCSLSLNDMHLISMIFRTQMLFEDNANYSIELVNYPSACDLISNRYPYLQIAKITEHDDFLLAIASEIFPEIQSLDPITEIQMSAITDFLNTGKVNIFDRWLRSKAESLLLTTTDISTEKNILSSYIGWEAP